jgi:hypothetical protein
VAAVLEDEVQNVRALMTPEAATKQPPGSTRYFFDSATGDESNFDQSVLSEGMNTVVPN